MAENIAVEETAELEIPEESPQVDQLDPPEPEVEETEPTSKPGREAAKYRKQLRETEQQLQDMTASLTAARTQILRAAATDYRVGRETFNIAALEDAGFDQDALYGDDGQLDPNKLAEQMTALHQAKPYLFTEPARLLIPNEGKSPSDNNYGATFTEAFKPQQ